MLNKIKNYFLREEKAKLDLLNGLGNVSYSYELNTYKLTKEIGKVNMFLITVNSFCTLFSVDKYLKNGRLNFDLPSNENQPRLMITYELNINLDNLSLREVSKLIMEISTEINLVKKVQDHITKEVLLPTIKATDHKAVKEEPSPPMPEGASLDFIKSLLNDIKDNNEDKS